ncbi:MAG: cyclic nucleotide-binding domain-containing protein [Planctomycetota bacterium]|jgi:CRP-like cAMP-binding protein
MDEGALGQVYEDGTIIMRQGDVGDRMYVIQEGEVDIIADRDGAETFIRTAGQGELIGEMAIFERDVRSATVRAHGTVRLLTVDRRNFLRRVHEDPSLAFRVVQTMSQRIRWLTDEVARLKGSAVSP